MKLLGALLLANALSLTAAENPLFSHDLLQQNADTTRRTDSSLSDVIAKSPFLTLHRALCEVESVIANELAVGELLVSFLEAHNFTVFTQSVHMPNATPDRFNVYAVPDVSKYDAHFDASRKALPKVLLTSHMDTVPPHIPYSLSAPKSSKSRKDILIAGRGTVDDKACVAAQIQTVMELLADPSSGMRPSDLALLFVVGEEGRGDGMKHFTDSDLYRQSNGDYRAILFGEPTELKLAEGHKGIAMLHIDAQGKAAHSGYPWLGKSANSMILPTLMVLDKLGDIAVEDGGLPRSKKFGKSTVNVGRMEGGVAANVVPERAHADVSFRLAGGSLDEVKHIILNAIHAADPDDELDLDLGLGYGPITLDADVDGFETIAVNYGTDVPNLDVAEGVKRYLYGPGSILVAHGANEGLTVGDLEEAVKGYKKLVRHALDL